MSDLPPPPNQNPKASRAEARADAKASAARAKSMRPWYRKKRFILGGAFLLLVVVIAASAGSGGDDGTDTASGNGGSENTNEDSGVSQGAGSQDASGDVELTECGQADGIGWGEATLTVTNNSSGRSNYFITVAWESEDGGTRHGDAMASAMNIEPDQTSTVTAGALEEMPADAVCRVIEVQRTAS